MSNQQFHEFNEFKNTYGGGFLNDQNNDSDKLQLTIARHFWRAAALKATLAERERCALVCEQEAQRYDDAMNASVAGETELLADWLIVAASMKLSALGCAAAISLPLPPTATPQGKI